MAPIPKAKTLLFLTLLVSSLTMAISSPLIKFCIVNLVIKPPFLAILLTGAVDGNSNGDDYYDCVYTVFVRKGSAWKGGTDSVIGVELAGADGLGVRMRIADRKQWGGLMGPRHDYYERGSLDLFSGRGPCMPTRPCWMKLTSDGSGASHGWYCSSVEVTVTGPRRGCAQWRFEVGQWLATDASPYRLDAVRDQCRGGSRVAAA